MPLSTTPITPGPRRRRTSDGFLPTTEDFAKVGERALGALGSVAETLGRPAAAISETYGAYQAGEGPLESLEAGLRGLSGGRPRYPTLGGQLAPDNPGTALMIDIGADPLMFLPVGKIARVGATALHRGARAAATTGLKLAGTTPQAVKAAAKASPGLQKVSRLVMPMQGVIGTFGGRAGKLTAGKARRAYLDYQQTGGFYLQGFKQALRDLKLDGARHAAQRSEAFKLIREGRIGQSSDERVNKFAEWVNQQFMKIRDEVAAHRDTFDSKGRRLLGSEGDPMMVRLRSGKMIPFEQASEELYGKYVPQMLKQEWIDKLMAAEGNSKRVEAIAKQLKITPAEAKNIIDNMAGGVRRAGHLEMERLLKNIPEEYLDTDLAHVFPRYVNQMARRLAMAKQFGNEYQYLDNVLAPAMEKSGLDADILNELRKMISEPFSGTKGKYITPEWARAILTGMVVTKMGITSSVSNISQSVNTAVVDGGANFLRGVFKSLDPQARRQMLIAYHGGLQDQLRFLVGAERGLANKYLKAVGFDAAEMVNRVLAANSGLRTAERLTGDFLELEGRIRQATSAVERGRLLAEKSKIMRNLTARGVKRHMIDDFRRLGNFRPAQERRVGLIAANRTQHITSFLDIPPAWRSPEARLMTQYKSFIYQQSRFITKEVLSPLNKYIASGGKEGSAKPFIRALVAFGAAGPVVSYARQAIREMTLNPEKKKFDRKHPLMELLRNSTYVGGLGIANDVMERALQGDLVEWFAGPAASELGDAIQTGARSGYNAFVKGEYPGVGDVAQDVFERTAPGAIRHSVQFEE